MKRLGYVRLSKDDAESFSVENQRKDLLHYDPRMRLFIDDGVSGEINLVKPDGAWAALWAEFMAEPTNSEICMVAFDRIGRKQGKVLSAVEDVIDLGGAIYVVEDAKRYDRASEGVAQDIALTFQSFSNSQYRKGVSRKTKRSLGGLVEAGVKLGPPPKFGEKEIAKMREYYAEGFGLKAIGKLVRLPRKDGTLVNTSKDVVRRVVSGEYMSREAWNRHNAMARLRLAERIAGGDSDA